MGAINRFVRYLKEMRICGFLPGAKIYGQLLNEYKEWMRCYRAAAQGTLQRRQEALLHFFEWLGDDATEQGLSMLSPQDVERFFLEYSRGRSYHSRSAMQAGLRTFFRFCHARAYTSRKLDEAVPSLRTYKLARAPRGLTDEQARAVLENISPSKTDAQRRDYAILQMLYTYGVRGGQVRCLRLEDVHWARDEILFRATKRGNDVLLPLTQTVGEPLLDYLSISRPRTRRKEVFLTCRAPYRPLTTTALAEIVKRRLLQAGIQMNSMGTYVFRHWFATRKLSQGQSIKSIADVLGHRSIEATFVYTKVDFQRLHAVALDWPEEEL
jgi:site-specific recombinase XerD